jgi:hypothetical protein
MKPNSWPNIHTSLVNKLQGNKRRFIFTFLVSPLWSWGLWPKIPSLWHHGDNPTPNNKAWSLEWHCVNEEIWVAGSAPWEFLSNTFMDDKSKTQFNTWWCFKIEWFRRENIHTIISILHAPTAGLNVWPNIVKKYNCSADSGDSGH